MNAIDDLEIIMKHTNLTEKEAIEQAVKAEVATKKGSTYSNYRDNKIDRYEALSKKNEVKSDTLWKQANDLSRAFEGGQPILIGHHSEKGARRLQEKIHTKSDQSLMFREKAEYYQQKAASASSNTAISSRDPKAVRDLSFKIFKLEGYRDLLKSINKKVRAAISAEKLNDALTEDELAIYHQKHNIHNKTKHGIPKIGDWVLKNLGATIRATQKRLNNLVAIDKLVIDDYVNGDMSVVYNSEMRTIQVEFPGKPSESARDHLKKNGFRWVSSCGFWSANYSNYRWEIAVNIIDDTYRDVPNKSEDVSIPCEDSENCPILQQRHISAITKIVCKNAFPHLLEAKKRCSGCYRPPELNPASRLKPGA